MTVPKKYKNPLEDGREADLRQQERLKELKGESLQTGLVVEEMMDELAGTDKQGYQLVKSILGMNFNAIKTNEALAQRDIMCKDLVAAIYTHINDMSARVHVVEQKQSPKYFFDKAKWLAEGIRAIILTAIAVGGVLTFFGDKF